VISQAKRKRSAASAKETTLRLLKYTSAPAFQRQFSDV